MPDGPMPSQGGAPSPPAPAGGQQPDQSQGQGGGIAQAIVQLDALASKIAQVVSQNPQVGNDVKTAWQDALQSLRKAEQALVQAAGGGGEEEPDEDDQGSGTTTPQQGASGAVPMTHQSVRGR